MPPRLFLAESTGRAPDLTSTDMPVLSEDSGECLPGHWACHSLENKSLPDSPGQPRKQLLLAWALSLGNESLGRKCAKTGLKCSWRGCTGQEVSIALGLLYFFLTLIFFFFFFTLSSGLHETLALLTSQLRPDSNHKEEMGFLRDVFSEKSLSYLMKVKSSPRPGKVVTSPPRRASFCCSIERKGNVCGVQGKPGQLAWEAPA